MEGLWFWLAVGGAAAAVASYTGLLLTLGRVRRIRRSLRSLPLRSIRQLQDGPAVVQGRVAEGDTLRAPLDGALVVGYRLTVLQLSPEDRRQGGWRVLLDQVRLRPFSLADGSGMARVVGPGAVQLLLDWTTVQQVTAAELEGRVDQGELVLDHSPRGRGPVQLKQATLALNSPVCVHGQARRVLDLREPPAGYREPPTQVTLEPPARGALFVANLERDPCLRALKRGGVELVTATLG